MPNAGRATLGLDIGQTQDTKVNTGRLTERTRSAQSWLTLRVTVLELFVKIFLMDLSNKCFSVPVIMWDFITQSQTNHRCPWPRQVYGLVRGQVLQSTSTIWSERDWLLPVWGKIKCAVDGLDIRKSKSFCCHPTKETALLRLKPGNNLGLSTHVSCAGLQGPALHGLCWANLRNGHGCPLKTVLFLSPKYFSSFIRMRTLLKVSQQASLIHFTDERSKAQAS